MPVMLTILSVLALWALLGVLVIGLLLILKPLENVRTHLEKIAMGVRAIEQETLPLGESSTALTGSLYQTANSLNGVVGKLAEVQRSLEDAAPTLRRML